MLIETKTIDQICNTLSNFNPNKETKPFIFGTNGKKFDYLQINFNKLMYEQAKYRQISVDDLQKRDIIFYYINNTTNKILITSDTNVTANIFFDPKVEPDTINAICSYLNPYNKERSYIFGLANNKIKGNVNLNLNKIFSELANPPDIKNRNIILGSCNFIFYFINNKVDGTLAFTDVLPKQIESKKTNEQQAIQSESQIGGTTNLNSNSKINIFQIFVILFTLVIICTFIFVYLYTKK